MTILQMAVEGTDTTGPICVWTWRGMKECGLEKDTIKISQCNKAIKEKKVNLVGEKY